MAAACDCSWGQKSFLSSAASEDGADLQSKTRSTVSSCSPSGGGEVCPWETKRYSSLNTLHRITDHTQFLFLGLFLFYYSVTSEHTHTAAW